MSIISSYNHKTARY